MYRKCLGNAILREYWMIYRGPGFLAVVWFGSSSFPATPFPSHVSKLDGDTQEDWERETTFWRERGREGGWVRIRIIRPQKSMMVVLYKSFNTLWLSPYNIRTSRDRLLEIMTKRKRSRILPLYKLLLCNPLVSFLLKTYPSFPFAILPQKFGKCKRMFYKEFYL
jgi:hypothetical protein